MACLKELFQALEEKRNQPEDGVEATETTNADGEVNVAEQTNGPLENNPTVRSHVVYIILLNVIVSIIPVLFICQPLFLLSSLSSLYFINADDASLSTGWCQQEPAEFGKWFLWTWTGEGPLTSYMDSTFWFQFYSYKSDHFINTSIKFY